MKMLATLSMLSLFVVFTISCGASEPQAPPAEAEPKASTSEPINEHMGEHFEQVSAVQKAIVRGDIEGIRAPAQWLASHPSIVGLPEGWSPFVKEMRDAARLAGEAKTFDAAGASIATMALTCGACHLQADAKPRIPELGTKGLPPADQIDTVPHMLRHQWAIEQMWVGLINPSEESWAKGVEVLADAPLEPQKMTDEAELSSDVGGLAQTVHQVGDDARQAEDWETRARIYGGLLSTCANCHEKLGAAIQLR